MNLVKGDPQWAMRRRVIVITLLTCLGLSFYAISKDAATAAAVVPSLSMLAGAVIGSYVFGASWERINGIPPGNTIYGDQINIPVNQSLTQTQNYPELGKEPFE
jgi:hypothetical protein